MKQCRKCGLTLPLDNFYRMGGGKPGYRGKCKACLHKQSGIWRKLNREKVVGYAMKTQAKRPEHYRAINNEASKRWKVKNADKRVAQHKISNSVRDGKLTPQPCHICKKKYGIEVKAEAHHSDYNKPFEVEYLCRKHHKAWHRVFLAEQVCQ